GAPPPRPHHYAAHTGPAVRHAAGQLDEILRALLARDPADEQNDRLVIREGLWLRDVGSGARVVQPPRHDVDAGRIDLVRFDHLSAHTEAVADNVVRREQPLPFAAPDLAVLSRPRAVALRGVDVRSDRAPRYLVRSLRRGIGDPVVAIDHVMGLRLGDLGRDIGNPLDLVEQIDAVWCR